MLTTIRPGSPVLAMPRPVHRCPRITSPQPDVMALLALLTTLAARLGGRWDAIGAAPPSEPASPLLEGLRNNFSPDAMFIERHLEKSGSPAAGRGVGEMMVRYGREYDVDPRILLAIAGHETGYGKLGVGMNGMLGVGAYDSDPDNATRNPEFSGLENQVRKGAETFANLRARAGVGPDAPIEVQLQAVNRAGWATDPAWYLGVLKHLNLM